LRYADDTTLLAQAEKEMAMAVVLPQSFQNDTKHTEEGKSHLFWELALQIKGEVKKKLRDESEWQNPQLQNFRLPYTHQSYGLRLGLVPSK